MARKKENTSKSSSNNGNKNVSSKGTSDGKASSITKPEKIAFSFPATASFNESLPSIGNQHTLWVSKNAMIKCCLSYGDIVIVQTGKDEGPAAVQLSKSLRDDEVSCSDSLFRCLSPTMDIIPVVVFRLTPSSFITDASHITLSLHCKRKEFDRFNKDRMTSNSNQDFIHTILMKLLNSTVLKGQSILFTYMGITVRGLVTSVDFSSTPPSLPSSSSSEPAPLLLGTITYQTQINLHYMDDTVSPSPSPSSTSTSTTPVESVISETDLQSINKLVGGLKKPIQDLQEVLYSALFCSQRFNQLNVTPPKGVLLYGPPGSGKTLLVRSMVAVHHLSFFTINISSLLSQYLGDSEKQLTQLFSKARQSAPSIIFLDEVDALCPPRELAGNNSSRLCSLLLSLFDDMKERVIVIGATNRPNGLDTALRRPGRFDKEIEIEVPTNDEKKEIIEIMLSTLPHNLNNDDICWLSNHTNGFTGADLRLLFTEASLGLLQVNEVNEHKETMVITLDSIKLALPKVRPSALREVTVTNPNVHWSDIGGLEKIKAKLNELINWPFLYADKLKKFNITPPKGVLLYGPPGCSKTLLAKAVATEANMNFISVKGPELYSKYVGESEQAVASVFRRARLSAPCVIFFDEIDAFASARGSTSGVTERVVSQFLTELDGIHVLKRVLIIAATNRPDLLDPALLRPGRLDTHIFLGLPDIVAREKILNVHLSHVPLDSNINVNEIATKTEGYSGAELAAVCTEACMNALNEDIDAKEVRQSHLLHALTTVKARTSPELLQLYIHFNEQNAKA